MAASRSFTYSRSDTKSSRRASSRRLAFFLRSSIEMAESGSGDDDVDDGEEFDPPSSMLLVELISITCSLLQSTVDSEGVVLVQRRVG
jgi:hypothetical protein